jgi:hypothetical protein
VTREQRAEATTAYHAELAAAFLARRCSCGAQAVVVTVCDGPDVNQCLEHWANSMGVAA